MARALELLPEQGRDLHIVPSKPRGTLGCGYSPGGAENALGMLWEALVTQHQVTGKPAHDVRLVAAMQAHGLTAILTFDKSGFSRYPGIEAVHPENVKA